MDAAKYFEDNRYIYLTGALPKEECSQLSNRLIELMKSGHMNNDDQCPKSYAIYGDEALDEVLFKIAPLLSKQLGVELLPTYTYARVYQPGEVLEKHTDRPSCEISGTMTLGVDPDSEIWPIYFGKTEDDPGTAYEIDIGDLVIYRGNELSHWRPAYKGNWQTQVFFHFVDANGPHKDWAFDKNIDRVKKFAPHLLDTIQQEPEKQEVRTPIPDNNYVMVPPLSHDLPGYSSFNSKFRPDLAFTKEECEKIISIASRRYPHKAKIGGGNDDIYAKEVRDVELYGVDYKDDTRWIFNKLISAITIANAEYYQYDLVGITHELQLLHYRSDEFQGHYDWHIDAGPGVSSTRKLSISVMLSPEDAYEGGNLIVNTGNVINSCKEQGSINMFPSYAMHKVEPVTAGERWALVIWVHGHRPFR